jgi:hypothetical protein
VRVASREVGRCELERREAIAAVYVAVLRVASYEVRVAICELRVASCKGAIAYAGIFLIVACVCSGGGCGELPPLRRRYPPRHRGGRRGRGGDD